MILCLETATPVCSVALNESCCTIAVRETEGQNAHSEKITNFIREVMEVANIDYRQLDAVAVSRGPGSYTGLRIGVSTAKGICYAANLPLMAIDTLEAMAYGMKTKLGSQISENDLLIPMIDARRMEVYTAVFDAQLNKINDTAALVIDENSFEDLLPDHHLWLFGDGAPKLSKVFENQPHISIVDGFKPSAAFMLPLAEKALREQRFVDVVYFEPFYLKDFIAGKPHVKGLGLREEV
ncbi:MAG: tRNA (adenosine(37)-N6)-threonylcarbamoyltransferase complex dimerization subunit type 1 TsaB [Bacteroidales bacterium]|nr:tRNA (adenosine(37)-N6)-threonylcarbamoyltransferase complex dimerization subunit type 1 TsaB [Bacteroidales bacterium]